MKTKKIFTVMIVAFILTGCGTVLQTAVVATDMAIKAYDAAGSLPNQESNPDVVIGEQIGAYVVANYIIMTFDGRLKKEPVIFFIAHRGGDSRQAGSIAFEKKNPEDMQMINDFNQMDEMGKKKFIKDHFLKTAKLDLGPIESETPEKSPTTPSAPSFPVPAFAPQRLQL